MLEKLLSISSNFEGWKQGLGDPEGSLRNIPFRMFFTTINQQSLETECPVTSVGTLGRKQILPLLWASSGRSPERAHVAGFFPNIENQWTHVSGEE